MWSQRLVVYEKEESELRAKLQQDSGEITNGNEMEEEVKGNLERWKGVLFGGVLPQADFAGDVYRFLAVRYDSSSLFDETKSKNRELNIWPL